MFEKIQEIISLIRVDHKLSAKFRFNYDIKSHSLKNTVHPSDKYFHFNENSAILLEKAFAANIFF
jgi:hypothetical protein